MFCFHRSRAARGRPFRRMASGGSAEAKDFLLLEVVEAKIPSPAALRCSLAAFLFLQPAIAKIYSRLKSMPELTYLQLQKHCKIAVTFPYPLPASRVGVSASLPLPSRPARLVAPTISPPGLETRPGQRFDVPAVRRLARRKSGPHAISSPPLFQCGSFPVSHQGPMRCQLYVL